MLTSGVGFGERAIIVAVAFANAYGTLRKTGCQHLIQKTLVERQLLTTGSPDL
jgi:hypothetical protein